MSQPPRIDPASLELSFPEPEITLRQGHGAPCSWAECMRETAAQTIYYLKHFGHLPPPPPPEEPFCLEPAVQPDVPSVRSFRSQSRQKRLLDLLPAGTELPASALMRRLELRHRANFRARYLNPALRDSLIERTHPDHPHSPLQRYRRARGGEGGTSGWNS
jgi:hypothetical protein